MKKLNFKIPFYNFNVTLIQIEGKKDADAAERMLKAFGAENKDIDEVVGAIRRGAINGGETFREMRRKKMLVIFYLFDSSEKMIECYNHEKRHVEDRILQWSNVDDIEASAMLSGWLGVKFRKLEQL